jgi:NADPH:quinone reductase-like Zn-dependent oxidoreductase
VKAFVFERTGDPNDVLAVRELPKPKPGPGEILVRALLSPVRPSDMHIMRAASVVSRRYKPVPASSASVSSWRLGPALQVPHLARASVQGLWRELIVSPAERVIPVPGDLSDEDAAQALVNPVAAWVMTMVEHDLKPGDWLVQTAAGSTVGQLVLQLARLERFRTVNIVRRRAQVPDIKALSGEVVITSVDNDWGTKLATASQGEAPSRALRLPPRNVIGHRILRMPCATRMGHRAKASHCLTLAAGLQAKGSCCGPIFNAANDALSRLSARRGSRSYAASASSPGNCNRHRHV